MAVPTNQVGLNETLEDIEIIKEELNEKFLIKEELLKEEPLKEKSLEEEPLKEESLEEAPIKQEYNKEETTLASKRPTCSSRSSLVTSLRNSLHKSPCVKDAKPVSSRVVSWVTNSNVPVNVKWYKCPHCCYKDTSMIFCRQHVVTNHSINELSVLSCQYCCFNTKFISTLINHVHSKHSHNSHIMRHFKEKLQRDLKLLLSNTDENK